MVCSPHWNRQTSTSTAPDSLLLAGFCQHDDNDDDGDDDEVNAYNDRDDDQEQGEPWGGEQQRAGETRQCPGEQKLSLLLLYWRFYWHLLSAFFIRLFYWAFLLAFSIGLFSLPFFHRPVEEKQIGLLSLLYLFVCLQSTR